MYSGFFQLSSCLNITSGRIVLYYFFFFFFNGRIKEKCHTVSNTKKWLKPADNKEPLGTPAFYTVTQMHKIYCQNVYCKIEVWNKWEAREKFTSKESLWHQSRKLNTLYDIFLFVCFGFTLENRIHSVNKTRHGMSSAIKRITDTARFYHTEV